MKQTINIKNMDGSMEQVELINSFKINSINRNFVILSKGESAGEGMSKIYVSEVVEETPGVYKLMGIQDDSIWTMVKQAMKEIVES